jgi:hypothetical protein
LAVSELEQLLKQTGAKQQVAFIDACRSDPDTKGADKPRSFDDLTDSEGLRVLYSTAPGQVSYEDDNLEHGIFSYFLLKGLQGEASGGNDGFITFEDLHSYVASQMRVYAVSKGHSQKPYAHGENSGDFLIAKRLTPALPVAPTLTPPKSDQFGADPSAIELGGSTKLRWNIPGATSVRIEPGFSHMPGQGEATVSPQQNTEYILTPEGAEGAVPQRLTIRVSPHIRNFDSATPKIDHCGRAQIRWSVMGATKVSVSGVGSVNPVEGYKLVKPATTTKFVLTAEGPGGASHREFTITVTPNGKPCDAR